MFTFIDNLPVDMTVVAMVSFVMILALLAIYKMHNIKDAVLFLLYIAGSVLVIYLFMSFPSICAIVVFLYIMRLVYRNTHSEA